MILLKLAKIFHLIKPTKYKELRVVKVIQSSKLFDAHWYLKTYPDVKSKMSAAKHYYKYGWKEGRNPSPLFDGNAYLEKYPDVKASGRNPLEHYLNAGRHEGRRYFSITGRENGGPSSFWKKVRHALTYPVRLQQECDRLRAEIQVLQKQHKN